MSSPTYRKQEQEPASEEVTEVAPGVRLFVVLGFLGSFTTYSAFGFETFELLRGGRVPLALGLIAAHLTLGLGAVWLGFRALS